LLLATAVCGWPFFAYYQSVLNSSSSAPTDTATEELIDHGHTRYITPDQRRTVSLWFAGMFLTTFAALGYSFYFIRFTQTLKEISNARNRSA